MKKIIVLAIMVIASISFVNAVKPVKNQNVINPRGLYRMQKISYEDGSEPVIPPFEQYKFCSDILTLQIAVQGMNNDCMVFYMQNNDKKVLNYTGKLKKSKEIQIFDTSKDEFTLRWYNSHMPNSSLFPYNAYSLEKYSRDNILLRVAEAFEALQGNYGKGYNKFHRRMEASWHSAKGG